MKCGTSLPLDTAIEARHRYPPKPQGTAVRGLGQAAKRASLAQVYDPDGLYEPSDPQAFLDKRFESTPSATGVKSGCRKACYGTIFTHLGARTAVGSQELVKLCRVSPRGSRRSHAFSCSIRSNVIPQVTDSNGDTKD
jgi:hypothetical protein